MCAGAVFGAGPALGLSVARRFGRAGYAVTLVGRNPATLGDLHSKLDADGVRADTVRADLADGTQVSDALDELKRRYGTPDVVVYGPGDVSRLPVSAAALDADTLRTWLPLHLLTPIQLLHTLLPDMSERGSGAVIFAHGSAIHQPQADLASVGIPQAGLVNYLHAVDAQVRAGGVRVGSLQILRLIEGSAAARLFDTGHFDGVEVGEVVRVAPDVLAQSIFEMATTDVEVERVA